MRWYTAFPPAGFVNMIAMKKVRPVLAVSVKPYECFTTITPVNPHMVFAARINVAFLVVCLVVLYSTQQSGFLWEQIDMGKLLKRTP